MVLQKKNVAKQGRNSSLVTAAISFKSCGESGYSFARSKQCSHHNFTIQETIENKIDLNYQRYTVSILLRLFSPTFDDLGLTATLKKSRVCLCFLEM